MTRYVPAIGGDTLADDAPGHRDELVVDVGDSQLVDFLANLFNQIGPAVGIHMVVDFHFLAFPVPRMHP